MKISYNWLKKYINLDISIEEISNHLTSIGLEVEGIVEHEMIRGGLKGIVIGKVLTKIQHPNADKLSLTTVDIGEDSPSQIICGAPNIDIGQKVLVATLGTILFNGDIPYKIKQSKIRGELSMGMICSEDELGLGSNHEGIMMLDSKAKVGLSASKYFNLTSDIVFDIGLTPNRSDAMSHIGVARDLMTLLNYKYRNNLKICRPEVDSFRVGNTLKGIKIDVKDFDACPRYSGVSISGVTVKESPQWLKHQLEAIGVSPINNIVDITNYVLHEIGQPLHAFDISSIEGDSIIVQTLRNKTKFITLDGSERELSSNDLMICDIKKPLCIAGIFGGIESGISASTKDIFLESAYFHPVSIRKTAKYHTLNTDASFRFERGCDPEITIYALKRAALLIQDIAGGEVASEIIDVYPDKIPYSKIDFNFGNMDLLIGTKIDREVVKSILIDLGIKINKETKKNLSLLVPPFKVDVKREVDIIEEVLRIYGFNNISIPSKFNVFINQFNHIDPEKICNRISDLLANNGFSEAMNNSLVKSEYSHLIKEDNLDTIVQLLNPLSTDINIMRQNMLFGVLENIRYNNNRQQLDIKLFEFGKIYNKVKTQYKEEKRLILAATGRQNIENWNAMNNPIDFFYIKQQVHTILNNLGINQIASEIINTHGISNGLAYTFQKKVLVRFGKVNNKISNLFDLRSEVYISDFNWSLILELVQSNNITYTPLNKFPEVRRDLSLLIDNAVSFDELKKVAIDTEKKILKSINLFDVYEGDNLPKNTKSYALSFIMSDKSRTLTDKEVDKVMNKLIKSFETKIGAQIR